MEEIEEENKDLKDQAQKDTPGEEVITDRKKNKRSKEKYDSHLPTLAIQDMEEIKKINNNMGYD